MYFRIIYQYYKKFKYLRSVYSTRFNSELYSNSNEYLIEEYTVRKANPTTTDAEINEKMYELTENEYYLSTEAKAIFLF